jgi:hypothetical protein
MGNQIALSGFLECFRDSMGVSMGMTSLRRAGHNIDEGAQAIVFAEIATCVFVARGAVADICDRFSPMKVVGRPFFQSRSASCRLRLRRIPAMLVHDDLRLFALRAKTGFNEVHFRLYHRHVVLRAALHHEAKSERRQVVNAGYIKEMFSRQNVRQSGKSLFRSPPCLWKLTISDCMKTAQP